MVEGRCLFAFFASLRVSPSAFCMHAKIREEREGVRDGRTVLRLYEEALG